MAEATFSKRQYMALTGVALKHRANSIIAQAVDQAGNQATQVSGTRETQTNRRWSMPALIKSCVAANSDFAWHRHEAGPSRQIRYQLEPIGAREWVT